MKKYIEEILLEMGFAAANRDALTPHEILEEVLKYEGLIGYGSKLRTWIKDIYGIDLDKRRS